MGTVEKNNLEGNERSNEIQARGMFIDYFLKNKEMFYYTFFDGKGVTG